MTGYNDVQMMNGLCPDSLRGRFINRFKHRDKMLHENEARKVSARYALLTLAKLRRETVEADILIVVKF